MFSLRNRFGIPGAISVIALVFAMLGGAYAASNNSGAGKATASAGKRGPRGPKGATGPAGPAGPQGPAGANGKDGAAGANGSAGSAGAPGTSVSNAAVPTGNPAKCEERGGAEFKVGVGTPTFACNGKEGEPGPEGNPWTDGGTLPVGATETGIWALVGEQRTIKDGDGNDVTIGFATNTAVAISFPIPTAEKIPNSKAIYTANTPDPVHCPGTYAEPKAASGYLCVYQSGTLTHAITFGPVIDSVAGARMDFIPEEGIFRGTGSWAVTG